MTHFASPQVVAALRDALQTRTAPILPPPPPVDAPELLRILSLWMGSCPLWRLEDLLANLATGLGADRLTVAEASCELQKAGLLLDGCCNARQTEALARWVEGRATTVPAAAPTVECEMEAGL